ncbi:MAG: hypothetical protein GC134_07535 [Proteobacteria bacterium]|nr:hypothetical protein [Pseudomonadota bacterium]
MEGNGAPLFDLIVLLLLIAFVFTRFFGKKLPKDKDRNKPNVVSFPDKTTVQTAPAARRTKQHHRRMEEIEKLEGVEKIKAFDASFNDKAFVAGAVRAYEWLHKAVADKDYETIENVTSPRLTEELIDALEDGHMPLKAFESVDDAQIIDCRILGRTAILDVRYDANHTDADGKKVKQAVIWTWARNVDETDPNWELEAINDLT